jgi:hypothetical protein
MLAIYPMVGGTATTHKYNLKDPRDSTAAFRLAFVGTWTHSSTGAKPNGSSYASTYFAPSLYLGASNAHMSFYSMTNNSTTNTVMGAQAGGPTGMSYRLQVGPTSLFAAIQNATSLSITGTSGFFIVSRNGGQTLRLNKNDVGSNLGSTITNTTVPNQNVLIGAYQDNGGINGYSDKECAFASIGSSLSNLEVTLLNQIVEKYQSDLGRSVTSSKPFYFNKDHYNLSNAFNYAARLSSTSQQTTINNLVDSLTSAGLLSKIYAIYPMIGGTAESHGINLTDVTNNLTFNGGWTHTSSGATPNGSNAYAGSGYGVVVNNAHISYYSLTSEAGGGDFGATGGNYQASAYLRTNSSNPYGANISLYIMTTHIAFSTFANNDGKGYYIANRTNSTQQMMFKNNVKSIANVNSSAAPTTAINFGVVPALNTSSPTAGWSYGNKLCAFATIGYGLTDAEASSLRTIVQSYQTSLGRQV